MANQVMDNRNQIVMPAVSPAVSDDEAMYWIALLLVPGLGPVNAVRLLERFKTPMLVLRAAPSELVACGISQSAARSITSGCTFDDAVVQQERMRAVGAAIVPYTHPKYPDLLKTIYDPPLVLFGRGNLDLLDTPMLGVVGTRRSTAYGMAATDKLSTDLALAGLTIVSGMARGIDTVAHKAALKVGGKTIAVFGAGIDHIYPAENRSLADDIAARGLLLSEYPLATPAHPQNFPRRNRVISGLSQGVLIVEGAQYSGSAITARLALDQGREVFAVPGPITAKMSWAPNLLIKQGAKLVQDSEDILSELRPETRRQLLAQLPEPDEGGGSNTQKQLELQLGPNAPVARAILDLLKIEESIQLDQLLEKLDQCSSTEVIAVLFELELGGAVRQLPGKNFVKVW